MQRASHEYLRRPYGVLFLSLLVTLIAAPVAAEYQLRTGPIELLLLANLAIAAVGYDTARGRRLLSSVVTIAVLLRFLGRWLHVEAASTGATVLSVALAVFAVIVARAVNTIGQ